METRSEANEHRTHRLTNRHPGHNYVIAWCCKCERWVKIMDANATEETEA